MLVLHGFWSGDDGLCLWAEDSERTVKSPSQAMRSARPHPFAAPADTLAELHAGKPGNAVLLLPSLLTAPLDSPELVRVSPRRGSQREPALLTWTVPVMRLDAPAALTALSEAVPGVRHGMSLTYLGELARLSAAALAMLVEGVGAVRSSDPWKDRTAMLDVTAAWAMVHGIADLALSGRTKFMDSSGPSDDLEATRRNLIERILPRQP